MAISDFNPNDMHAVISDVVQQATGQKPITPTNTSEFVVVAKQALATGYDPCMKSVGQVLGDTIIALREYGGELLNLNVSNMKYGNAVRKISMVEKDEAKGGGFVFDESTSIEDGKNYDMYKVNKPEAVQLNYYGTFPIKKHITIFRDQLNTAFRNETELGRFFALILNQWNDQIAQKNTNLRRACLTNLIAGHIAADKAAAGSMTVYHLLTEYKAKTGLALTTTAGDFCVYRPEYFRDFIQWAFARIDGVLKLMKSRSVMFHQNLTGKPIARFTPADPRYMRGYMLTQLNEEINAMALANTYHADFLKIADFEEVNFWQSIKEPDKINIKPNYLKADGTVAQPVANVEQSNILACFMDVEAAGVSVFNEWTDTTPFNVDGGYSNLYYHSNVRYWNDFTENCVTFVLD